ncbi:MAG TPA: MBL fold metallo-hydrolase [Nitrososphaerales archaeon]|nr:MBL fold metallo-hydrolase [Nitrososphaerales archaeon]
MTEILPGVHQIVGVNANSYLIQESDGSLILIDAGMSTGGKKILEYVKTNLSKQPSDLKTIVLTHAHIDHIRGVSAIKKATGAKVAIHVQDADFLSRKKKLPAPKGVTGFIFRVFSVFIQSAAVEPDIRLSENDKIGSSLKIVHTPGHTPGSISLYDQGKRLVFVGDAITNRGGKLQGSIKQFSVDLQQADRSVEKISALDFETLLSGHGDPIKSEGARKVRELSDSLSKK